MLEDPARPHKPDGGALFSCWLVLKKYKELHIDIDLSISLPRSVDIQEVLTIMENEYFNNYPELILERHPKLGASYTLTFQFSILSYSCAPISFFEPELQKKIKMIDAIVHTLYIVEKNPQDKKALENLTNLLLEMQ